VSRSRLRSPQAVADGPVVDESTDPASRPHPLLQLQATAGNRAVARAVSAVRDGGDGRPLSGALRSTLERSAGAGLPEIRLHDDTAAAALSRSQDALAVTHGSDIFIDRAEVDLTRPSGRFVLAHEVAHTLQPYGRSSADPGGAEAEAHRFAIDAATGRAAGRPTRSRAEGALARFERSERGLIANLDAVVETARTMARSAVHFNKAGPYIDQADLVHVAGGLSAGDRVEQAASVNSQQIGHLANRYLYTCGAGMIDMRHFYQLAYISGLLSNHYATEKGREHELGAEATSRFAPEDTTSNALGAYFGSIETAADHNDPEAFAEHLRAYLSSCHPIDFAALSPADQEAIVAFYSDRDAAGVPANQNEVATPQRPPIPVCGTDVSAFPFVVDPSDPKTVTGQVAPYNLTGDTEIRTWVYGQTDAALGTVPAAERERLVNRLLDGWVSEGDIGATERLLATAPAGDRSTIAGHIRSRADELWNEDQKRRLLAALGS
jgi:hypothetical protein